MKLQTVVSEKVGKAILAKAEAHGRSVSQWIARALEREVFGFNDSDGPRRGHPALADCDEIVPIGGKK